MIDEFRKYLEIDKHSLDDVVSRQPQLFFQVSEEMVKASALRDYLKEELANVDAGLDAKIRLKNKDTEKVTEGRIKALIQADKTHQASFKAYIDAKEEAEKYVALKDAFQQRAYMIRDLCSLYVANYFQEGSVKGTSQTDRMSYEQTRERLAQARANKAPRRTSK